MDLGLADCTVTMTRDTFDYIILSDDRDDDDSDPIVTTRRVVEALAGRELSIDQAVLHGIVEIETRGEFVPRGD